MNAVIATVTPLHADSIVNPPVFQNIRRTPSRRTRKVAPAKQGCVAKLSLARLTTADKLRANRTKTIRT